MSKYLHVILTVIQLVSQTGRQAARIICCYLLRFSVPDVDIDKRRLAFRGVLSSSNDARLRMYSDRNNILFMHDEERLVTFILAHYTDSGCRVDDLAVRKELQQIPCIIIHSLALEPKHMLQIQLRWRQHIHYLLAHATVLFRYAQSQLT